MKFKFVIPVICIFCLICFSSCKKEPENKGQEGYSYVNTPSPGELVTADNQEDYKKPLNIDNSWHSNFHVKYNYFNKDQSNEITLIEEKKASGAFTVEYVDTKTMLYYKANGDNTDYYVLVDNEDEQAHSVLEGKNFNSLSSMFMKLSALDLNLPTQSNVLFMYEDSVAGRPCRKFIQRAYSEGKLTQSVYVWVDTEFGFAAKCEAYDADENLMIMWEVKEFSDGNVDDSDVEVDLSKYNFPVEVG